MSDHTAWGGTAVSVHTAWKEYAARRRAQDPSPLQEAALSLVNATKAFYLDLRADAAAILPVAAPGGKAAVDSEWLDFQQDLAARGRMRALQAQADHLAPAPAPLAATTDPVEGDDGGTASSPRYIIALS